jgi:hypothetical protein
MKYIDDRRHGNVLSEVPGIFTTPRRGCGDNPVVGSQGSESNIKVTRR